MKLVRTFVALLAVLCVSGAVTSAVAQNPTQDNQPIRGELHKREAGLKKRIQSLYDKGRIDDNLLASLQRDLDAICTKEDADRMKNDGMSAKDKENINKKLDEFEKQIVEKETAK